jgi:hypothetical protein
MARRPEECISWGSLEECTWLGDLINVYSGGVLRNVDG